MSLIEILLGVAFPVLVGLGVSLTLSDATPTEFLIARLCYLAAGADLLGLVVYVLYAGSTWPISTRLVLGAVAGAMIIPATVGTLLWVDFREHRLASVISEKADVALRFVYPDAPALIIDNKSNAVAKDIKWTVALWNLDDPRRIVSQNAPPDVHDALPIPIQTFDFIRPHTASGPQNLFNNVMQYIKPGNRLFGSASVVCPDCSRGHTYFIYIEWGNGGWYWEVPDHIDGGVIIPQHLTISEVRAYSQSAFATVPAKERIPISAP